MTVTVTIDTDNAAFYAPDGETPEIGRAVSCLLDAVSGRFFRAGDVAGLDGSPIFDDNGNRIGQVTVR